jgi:hypothetical protein
MDPAVRTLLLDGVVIPAHPLALTATRTLDERRQRALTRYYVAAGAGGIAVGVHTTQFAIRNHGLFEPVLRLAADTARTALARTPRPFALVAGVVGPTSQATREADLAAQLGYDCALVSLAALPRASDEELVTHCAAIARVLPVFGFYLQPAVGGRVLSYDFWRRFADLGAACAIKIAPFNRYQTLDVARAVADSGRADIALYTGNDDNIVGDLVTPLPFTNGPRWIAGGLLGQWAVWTHRAVRMLESIQVARAAGSIAPSLLREGAALTAANAAIFDVHHAFAGCIAGIHEVLRRQGLLSGTWCLDPTEGLSRGQAEAIAAACAAHPELADDDFVREHLAEWLD